MKWWETLAVVVAIGGFAQLIKWIFESVGIEENLGTLLTFFLAILFSILLVIIFVLNQIQGEHKKMKAFLKKKGYQEEDSIMERILKRGMIDSRILWIPIIILLIYLIYEAFLK